MNCQECREELAAYLEGLLDETCQSRMDGHLAECTACQAELREVRELTDRLTRDGLAVPPVSLEATVMDRILQEQALLIRRLKMRKRIRVLGMSGAMAAAAVMLFIGGLWLTQPAEAQKAAEVLARGAEAVPNPSTVHITAKMRIPPGQYFERIDADGAMVPVEAWRLLGDRSKWRIQKSDMVQVMDDTSITLFAPPKRAWKHARRKDFNPRNLLLLQLTEVRGLIDRELRSALANDWDLKLTHETTVAGEKKLLVTVQANRGWPENNYAKNKFLDSSNIRRVYRFDAKTQRLEGMDAYLHRRSGDDVLVLTVERIEYDQPIDPALFVLTLPKDVHLVDFRKEYKEPERLPDNEKYEKMTPKEAAQAFFEACAREDWNEVQKFEAMPLTDGFKEQWGGLEIVHLGEPFKMKTYFGWYIPYEVKFKNGGVKKMNLCMRKDNPAKRYVVDGGF